MYWFPSNGSLSRPLSLFVLGEVVWNRNRNRNKLINQIRAPGGHIQITIMIDTQPQYIKLNISGEISIIVVQTHSGRKRDIYAHKRTYTYSHIYEGGNEREHIHISGDSSPICKYVGQVFKNWQEKNNLAQSIPLILYPLVHRTHFTFYAKNSAFSTFLPKKDGVGKISLSEVPPFASYTPAAVHRRD
jgi:hypothetical protein